MDDFVCHMHAGAAPRGYESSLGVQCTESRGRGQPLFVSMELVRCSVPHLADVRGQGKGDEASVSYRHLTADSQGRSRVIVCPHRANNHEGVTIRSSHLAVLP